MTPCEKLGYKAGDRFECLEANTGLYMPGDILILKEDDGSDNPWFLNKRTLERTAVHLDFVEKRESGQSIQSGDTIDRDGKKYRVTLEEIPQYDFKPGMLCRVIWDGSESCGCRSNYDGVVFIQHKVGGKSEIAYVTFNGDICVGCVKTSNLRPE